MMLPVYITPTPTLAPQFTAVYDAIVSLIGSINSIRKVI